MSILSTAQLVTLAQSVGFQGPDLATAVAIALVESSGNTQAQNPNEPSYGLWQIDTDYHPQFSIQQLLDPQANAQAAYQVYLESGSSFRQWTGSFTNGKYRAFLPQVQQTIAAMNPPPPQPAPDQTTTDQSTTIPGEIFYDSSGMSGSTMAGIAVAAVIVLALLRR